MESPHLGKATQGKKPTVTLSFPWPKLSSPISNKKIIGQVYIHYKKCKFGGKQNYF